MASTSGAEDLIDVDSVMTAVDKRGTEEYNKNGDTPGEEVDKDVAAKETNWNQSPFYVGGYFTKIDQGSARCNSCPATANPIKTKDSNTAGLDSHLSRKHGKVYDKYLETKKEVEKKREEIRSEKIGRKRRAGEVIADIHKTKQSKLEIRLGKLNLSLPPDPKLQKEWDDQLVDYIADTGVTFSQVSGEPMEKLVHVLNKNSRSKVTVKSRYTLARHVSAKAESVLREICAIIKACKEDMEGVAFTSDIWTTGAMDSFISLTAHWIDKDWVLHRFTPYTKHFPDRHSGVLIKIKLDEMIEGLEIDSPKIKKHVVNDNARNAVLAIKLSPHLFQVLCGCHSLQLAIGDTFKEVAVGGSKMVEVLDKGKNLSNSVKRSGPLQLELKNACKEVGITYTTLKNPNETRWNSQVINLNSILKLKPALLMLANNDTTGQCASKVFSPAEFKLAEAAVKVLQVPLFVTKAWEAEITPTMNLMISELFEMNAKLEDLAKTTCRFTSEFAATLIEKIDHRFPNCGSTDSIRSFGNYLDPAFRGIHLEALGALAETKAEIMEEWDEKEAGDGLVEQGVGVETVAEPIPEENLSATAKLLRARNAAAQVVPKRSKLLEEMSLYEGKSDVVKLEELPTNGDRLKWWKKHEAMLPTLAKAAKRILGIPCSSSKSERVFSTGSQIVTKKRYRLKAERIEHLIVLKENRKLVEDFLEKSSYEVNTKNYNKDNAFKKIVLERDSSQVPAQPASNVFAQDKEPEDENSLSSSDSEDEVEVADE